MYRASRVPHVVFEGVNFHLNLSLTKNRPGPGAAPYGFCRVRFVTWEHQKFIREVKHGAAVQDCLSDSGVSDS